MSNKHYARKLCALLAAVSMMATVPLAVNAQQPMSRPQAQSAADAKAKVTIASGLVAYGKQNKDPLALLTAARMMSAVGANIEDPKAKQASGDAANFDVGAILKEAKDFAGDNKALQSEITLAEKNMPQKWACYYAWACNCCYCEYYYYC